MNFQSKIQFKVGVATDIGRRRSQNQDSLAAFPELGLFIVADGMGGHRGGETASQIAVEVVTKIVQKEISQPQWEATQTVTRAVEAANQAIFARALEHSELQGMGTTTTVLLFQEELLVIGHVGDSRCYFLRPQCIWQATRDHSLVQEKLKAGLITREEMKTDRMRNVITRSVGFDRDIKVEVYQMRVQPSDTFLICSDGLSGLVEDEEILKIIQSQLFESDNIKKAADELIAAANFNGGDDNITAILTQVM